MPIKLIAAPHTPMDAAGALNVNMIERQACFLAESGVSGVFVAGSTGEGPSLTVEERRELARRWASVGPELGLQVVVHVGHNSQPEAVRLAAHVAEIGADAVSAMAPCYFKPRALRDLIDFFEPIADAAAPLPFYFYDIPELTGVSLSTVEFLRRGVERLPNLAGVKYTNPDLAQFQECVRLDNGRFEIWFGCDEAMLAGYALGARGAVGSSYNFAAPLYHQMVEAADSGDDVTARKLQLQSIELIRTLQEYEYAPAAKSVMALLGVDCGPVRAPLRPLTPEQKAELAERLRRFEFLNVSSMG